MPLSDDTQLALLKRDVAELRHDIEKLTTSVEDLVAAWKTAGHLVTFVKWLAGAIGAVGIIWALITTGKFTH